MRMQVEYFNRHKETFKRISFALHSFGTAHYTTAVIYDYFAKVYRHHGKVESYFFRFRFFTHWNLYIQWAYFSFRTANDLNSFLRRQSRRKKSDEFLDHFQVSLAFPFSMFVTCMYWLLIMIDPNYIHTGASNKNPTILNHMIHTNILPLQIFDYLTSQRYYKSRIKSIATSTVVQSLYFACMMYFYQTKGNWSYPIIGILDDYKRCAFVFGCFSSNVVFYCVGEILNAFLWGISEEHEPSEIID